MQKYVIEIINNPSFLRLKEIGGGKVYHNEGDAYIHSLLVYQESLHYWQDSDMNLISLLHDIGKVYTGKMKENGDWEYPDHARVGAARLEEFVPAELAADECFMEKARWYISNHVKPLFWQATPEANFRNLNLAKLALCDLAGSWSDKPQNLLTGFLAAIVRTFPMNIGFDADFYADQAKKSLCNGDISEAAFFWNKIYDLFEDGGTEGSEMLADVMQMFTDEEVFAITDYIKDMEE